jgi:hypothetical protein
MFFVCFTGPRAGQYLTHRVVPEGEGKGSDLANITFSVLEEFDSSDSLDAVLMDNTATNTGYSGGLCACLERKLQRKVHLIGCFLHVNELPLRHLITQLDGKTISGNKFSGPIGQKLGEDIHRENPVAFVPVPAPIEEPDSDLMDDLSDDQKILLAYIFGVSSGTIDEKFVHRKPGPVNLSRWLTTATRILYLYTRTEQPSDVLKVLVKYIVNVYGLVWFKVKTFNTFTNGPLILFGMIREVKEMDENSDIPISDIVLPVLQRNAFCCLGENFLASLLYSESTEHRQLAVDKILTIRSDPEKPVTPARIPKLNFDAEDWSQLIDVPSLVCQEPPCVRKIPSEELRAMIAVPASPPEFPLHSQSVERAVKLTSEAARTSYIWEKKHKYIVAKTESRAKRPHFRTKRQYV